MMPVGIGHYDAVAGVRQRAGIRRVAFLGTPHVRKEQATLHVPDPDPILQACEILRIRDSLRLAPS